VQRDTSTRRAGRPWARSARLARLTMAALVALLAGGGLAGAVSADQGLALSTPFPAVAVEPGKSVSFDLVVSSTNQRRVNLSVPQVPTGWTATLRGGGFVVDAVEAGPGTKPAVTLSVDVPKDAAEGTVRVVVRAVSGSASDELPLDLRVTSAAGGSVSMTTDNPALRDNAGATFPFTVQLKNDTPQELTFSLNAEGPQGSAGWDITAHPAGQNQAASVVVGAGSSQNVDVSVKPPDDVAAGTYPVTVQAVSGDQTASIDLQVEIVGQEKLQLTTPDQRLSTNATAGARKDVQLVVANQGTAPLANVALSGTGPTGWDIAFDKATIAEIPPQKTETVTAHLTPSGSAIAGDYQVTFTARTADSVTQSIQMRVTVDTSLSWGLVGIGLIGLTVVGLGWVFQRYGRR